MGPRGFYCFCIELMPHVRTHGGCRWQKINKLQLVASCSCSVLHIVLLLLVFSFFFFLHHMRRCSISVTCRNGRKASPANPISEWDRPLFPPPSSMPTDAVKHIYYWHGRGNHKESFVGHNRPFVLLSLTFPVLLPPRRAGEKK